MSLSQTIEKIPQSDNTFSRKITEEVKYLNRCYQCSMCSDGCPVAYAMDYYPNQIIHLVRLGLKEKALQSTTIWLCASCETCATRCPNEIEIVRLMDVLRGESLKAGIKSRVSNISKFHQAFVEQIKKRGRVDEASLMISYELKTGEFLSMKKLRELAGLAIQMLLKGKIKLPSLKRHSTKAIKEIYKKALTRV
ncbi:4Fe-4S dicluster domain-containing protein [Chloroflexota bacterium]